MPARRNVLTHLQFKKRLCLKVHYFKKVVILTRTTLGIVLCLDKFSLICLFVFCLVFLDMYIRCLFFYKETGFIADGLL